MKKKFTLCLVGVGRMGEAHAQAAQQLGGVLVSVCDRSQERLNEFAQQYKLPSDHCFTNVEQMLEQSIDIDLIVISTTADSHCELTCLAAQRGIPFILCEKPMATSLEDCEKMIQACQKSGSLLAINHQMRFMPQYTFIKEYLERGQFGRLASMNVLAGCFGLSMNGSHYIEAFSYLTDSKPIEVTAWFSSEQLPNPRGDAFFDRAGQIRVLSEDGQRLAMEIGSDQGHGMTVSYGAQFGHIFVDELGGEIHAVARKEEYRDSPPTRYGMPSDRWQQTFTSPDNVSCTKAVLSALLAGNNYPSGEDGRRVVNTLVAAYYSVEQANKAIELSNPGLPYQHKFPWA